MFSSLPTGFRSGSVLGSVAVIIHPARVQGRGCSFWGGGGWAEYEACVVELPVFVGMRRGGAKYSMNMGLSLAWVQVLPDGLRQNRSVGFCLGKPN